MGSRSVNPNAAVVAAFRWSVRMTVQALQWLLRSDRQSEWQSKRCRGCCIQIVSQSGNPNAAVVAAFRWSVRMTIQALLLLCDVLERAYSSQSPFRVSKHDSNTALCAKCSVFLTQLVTWRFQPGQPHGVISGLSVFV